ncbi:MAG: dephospho-CoA kinase [Candidatus Latescibacteria bacterium]|nr:dephospho-CoA kinase [Candidatus Latescibacterota bacterium]
MAERNAPAERRLLHWVVTGPIGAGKSLAVSELAALGARVVDADAEGRALLREPGMPASVAAALGAGVVRAGEVDRAAVAALVFADPQALARLDALVHPRLAARIAARLREHEAAAGEPGLAVVEAAVYFLLPPFGPVDLVVAIDAPLELRVSRLAASGRLDAAAARVRADAQRHLLDAFSRADVVLRNEGGPGDLRRAVRELVAARAPLLRSPEAPPQEGT